MLCLVLRLYYKFFFFFFVRNYVRIIALVGNWFKLMLYGVSIQNIQKYLDEKWWELVSQDAGVKRD